MRTASKIFVGVALAGLAAAGGAAFTGTGLTTTGQAAAAQFVGGTISQSVTGATLDSIDYGYFDGTNTEVDGITLTFTGGTANGKTVTATPTGASTGTFSCGAVSTNTSTCTYVPAGIENGYAGLSSLAVAVS